LAMSNRSGRVRDQDLEVLPLNWRREVGQGLRLASLEVGAAAPAVAGRDLLRRSILR
jgi:hypothetical protein